MSMLKELIHNFSYQHKDGRNKDLEPTRRAIQQMLGENEGTEAIANIRREITELNQNETRLLYIMYGALCLDPKRNNMSIQTFLVALEGRRPNSLKITETNTIY